MGGDRSRTNQYRDRQGADSLTPPPTPRRAIRFGLGAIKGVGAKAVAAIVDERNRGGPFRSLFDFSERVDFTLLNRGTVEALICAGAFDSTGTMRKAMVDGLERAMAAGQTAQRDRRSGQGSLFGGDPAVSTAVDEPMLGNAEWTEAEMLAREKNVLGFYITKHPLTSCEPLLQACATISTVDLGRFKDGDSAVLGGMISSVRMVAAKNGRNAGQQLGIITLEDLKGRVEAVVFPRDLVTYRPLLVPDAVVFLEGAVDRKREEPSLRVSRVITREQAPQAFARTVLLDIAPETDVARVLDVIRAHKGDCRVYLNVETADRLLAQIECHASFGVNCSPECLGALAALLGEKAVTVLGPNRRAIPQPPDRQGILVAG